MTDWYEDWKKKSETYKPAKDTDQGVLWLKQMALMSPHFKEIRDAKSNVSEAFLNACMQMAYDMGTQRIESSSYDRGYAAAMDKIAKSMTETVNQLGFYRDED